MWVPAEPKLSLLPVDIIDYATSIQSANGHEKRLLVKQTPDQYRLLIAATSFLLKSATPTERSYCVVHNIDAVSTCKICDADVKFKSNIKKYPTYCSKECAHVDSAHIHENRKSTNNLNWGCDNPSSVLSVQNRRMDTMLDKYGVKHAMQSLELQKKHILSMETNHGVDCVFKTDDFAKKSKQSTQIKYGVDHASQSAEVQQKVAATRHTNKHKYRYNDVDVKEQRKHTMIERYGVQHIKQKHLSSSVLTQLGDADIMRYKHHDKQQTLIEIAGEYGCSDTTVGRYLHKHGLDTKNFYVSVGEKQVRDYVVGLGFSVDANVRSVIYPYELDIYIPERKLAIEYCGLYWHSEQLGKDNRYHYNKWLMCKDNGIQLLTIFEDEWQHKREICETKIANLLHTQNSRVIYARITNIICVSNFERADFLNKFHIQGNGAGSVTIGLECDGDLVACMVFAVNKHKTFYLTRYATSCRVVGGFSKLLKHFTTSVDWDAITSFADRRWSDGGLYTKTGWTELSPISPDYCYVAANKRVHKFNYRLKNLPKLLANYDSSISEKQNCDNHGVLRIWDCGKMKFRLLNEPT